MNPPEKIVFTTSGPNVWERAKGNRNLEQETVANIRGRVSSLLDSISSDYRNNIGADELLEQAYQSIINLGVERGDPGEGLYRRFHEVLKAHLSSVGIKINGSIKSLSDHSIEGDITEVQALFYGNNHHVQGEIKRVRYGDPFEVQGTNLSIKEINISGASKILMHLRDGKIIVSGENLSSPTEDISGDRITKITTGIRGHRYDNGNYQIEGTSLSHTANHVTGNIIKIRQSIKNKNMTTYEGQNLVINEDNPMVQGDLTYVDENSQIYRGNNLTLRDSSISGDVQKINLKKFGLVHKSRFIKGQGNGFKGEDMWDEKLGISKASIITQDENGGTRVIGENMNLNLPNVSGTVSSAEYRDGTLMEAYSNEKKDLVYICGDVEYTDLSFIIFVEDKELLPDYPGANIIEYDKSIISYDKNHGYLNVYAKNR